VPGDALQLALFVLRAGLNASALLLIGLVLHAAIAIIGREALSRWRGLIVGLAITATVLAFVRLLLLNVQMGDASTLFDPDLTALGWMALGPSSLAFAAGAAVVVAGLALRQTLILAVGAVSASAGFALTGHTQALSNPGLAPYAVGMHVAIAGFWIAAPLTLSPRGLADDTVLLARLKRFSAAAVFLIPVLVVAGLWLAWILAGGVQGLLGTAYGQLLLLKLAAACIAIGLGAINKQVVTAKVAADPHVGRRWLNHTLTAETVLFLVALVAISAATTLTGAGEGLPAQ